MATAKRHVHTLAEPSTSHALKSGNDRQAILDNSFLRDQLKPSRLFSQLSPELNSPLKTSSPKERNGTPVKCPLFIPLETLIHQETISRKQEHVEHVTITWRPRALNPEFAGKRISQRTKKEMCVLRSCEVRGDI